MSFVLPNPFSVKYPLLLGIFPKISTFFPSISWLFSIKMASYIDRLLFFCQISTAFYYSFFFFVKIARYWSSWFSVKYRPHFVIFPQISTFFFLPIGCLSYIFFSVKMSRNIDCLLLHCQYCPQLLLFFLKISAYFSVAGLTFLNFFPSKCQDIDPLLFFNQISADFWYFFLKYRQLF